MASANDSIGVVVLEPNNQLLLKLCNFAARVWGLHEVLPRQTAKELENAASNLAVGLVIVRASFQRSSPLVQSTLLDMYAAGTQIIVIQDTAFKLVEDGCTSMAGLHFLSDQAGDEALSALLTLALIHHCAPRVNRLV